MRVYEDKKTTEYTRFVSKTLKTSIQLTKRGFHINGIRRRGFHIDGIRGHEDYRVDKGHLFHTSPAKCLIFSGILKCQESKIWAFFKGLRSFRGPQKQERKNDQHSIMRRKSILEKAIFYLCV